MVKIADHTKRFFSPSPQKEVLQNQSSENCPIFFCNIINKLKIYLLVLELEDKKQKLFYHFFRKCPSF